MANVPSHQLSPVSEISSQYPIDSTMETLWTKLFEDEYKPTMVIDFVAIKESISGSSFIKDYNDKIIKPSDLCDLFINNQPKEFSISFLESIPDNLKRSVADLILGTTSLVTIKKHMGIAMLFWLRHNCYSYSDRLTGDIKDFFINSTTFVESEKNYNQLIKSRMYQWQLHRKKFNINTTLSLFTIIKNLPDDLKTEHIQDCLEKKLGKGFSLDVLYTKHEYTSGKEEKWERSDLDSHGNLLDEEMLDGTSKLIREVVNDKTESRKVLDYDSDYIYKDFSGSLYKIYLDGPIGISLSYGKFPIAVISFSLLDAHTLFIHQMQAVSAEHFDRYGRSTGERISSLAQTIPWQESLYDIITLIAKKAGCKNIVIQSGENNPWIHKARSILEYNQDSKKLLEVKTTQPHLSIEVAEKIYDNFAMKEEFVKDDKTKNWDKEI